MGAAGHGRWGALANVKYLAHVSKSLESENVQGGGENHSPTSRKFEYRFKSTTWSIGGGVGWFQPTARPDPPFFGRGGGLK